MIAPTKMELDACAGYANGLTLERNTGEIKTISNTEEALTIAVRASFFLSGKLLEKAINRSHE